MDTKKELIMRTATQLFAENGFANTSVSSICKKAQVSKGLVYHHFTNKEELLRAIFAQTTERMKEIGASSASNEAPETQLVQLIEQLFTQLETDKSFFQLNLNIMLQPATRSILTDLIKERSAHILESVKILFEQIDPENYEARSYLFIAELDGVALDYLSVFEAYPLKEIKNQLITRYKKQS